MPGAGLTITAKIDGRSVSRDEVLAWEARRASKVCRKLGVTAPPGDLTAQREALVARKLELGHRALERLLARELRWSERGGRLLARLSRGRRRLCTVELTGAGGSAEAMPRFYRDAIESGDEAALLAACPDHYILRAGGDGLQQVVETTGGSPLAARIFLDEGDVSSVTTDADPAFPVQWVAVGATAPADPPTGAIRHQFRDGPDGFTARLTGEFPIATPPALIRAHRWHLACEFSNWIEAANLNPAELPMVSPDSAAAPSCSLDLDGLVAQRERYARIGKSVLDVSRSPRSLSIQLSPAVDVVLVEDTLRIERECCPFFDLGFDTETRVLTVVVDSTEQVPALDAIAFALGARPENPSGPQRRC